MGIRSGDATPGTNVTTGCAVCKVTAPCDVAELIVSTSPERKLSTTKILRSKTASTPLRIAHWDEQDLQTYDIIIDAIADHENAHEDNPKVVDIDGKVRWDPACSNGLVHDIILYQLHNLGEVDAPSSPEPGLPKKDHEHVVLANVHGTSIAALDIADEAAGTTSLKAKKTIKRAQIISLLFGLFVEAYQMHDAKRFALVAKSCGIRPGGTAANGELRALVEVFRKLSLTLTFEYPPHLEKKGKKGGLLDSDKAAPSIPTPPDTGVKLEVKVNGKEQDTSLLQKFLEGVRKVEEAIQTIADVVEKAPRKGWMLTWSIQVISGKLDMTLARAESPDAVEGRVLPLRQELNIKVKLSLVKVTLDLTFGYKKTGGWFVKEETLQVGLKITGELTIDGSLTLPDNKKDKLSTSALLSAELHGEGVLDVRWVGSVSLRASAKTGITATITIYDEAKGGFVPSFSLKLNDGTATIKGNVGAASGETTAKLWSERLLYEAVWDGKESAGTTAAPASEYAGITNAI